MTYVLNNETIINFQVLDTYVIDVLLIDNDGLIFDNTDIGDSGDEYPDLNDCSFEGVRQCAKKTLCDMSNVRKIFCAFGFSSCYGVTLLACVETNCVD